MYRTMESKNYPTPEEAIDDLKLQYKNNKISALFLSCFLEN